MRDFQEAQGETSWQQVSSYGAIEEGNVDDVDSPAERAALMSEAAGTAAISRRHRALVAGTVVMFLLAAVLNIPASPLAYLINSDSAPGTPRGHSFYESSWKQWAYGVRDYWADKREAWKLQKTDLQAKNASKADIKQAKASFWNSTVNDFGGSFNQPAWLLQEDGSDDD